MLVPPASFGARGTSLINTLRNLELTTNLQVCLDAGDANSYSGSGQTWTDLSGNGNHFYRGSGSGSDGADPTFTGTAGRMSSGDYFGYDGGDRFTLAQSAPSWQSGMHKAGGKFTILQWAYVGNLTGLAPSQAGFGCGDALSNSSPKSYIDFSNSSTTQNALTVNVQDDSNAQVFGSKSTILVTNNAWQMIAVSVTVLSDPMTYVINGASETRNTTATTTPSTHDSYAPLVIGALANDGLGSAINGCRIAAAAVWNDALTANQLISIFNATRGRFGV